MNIKVKKQVLQNVAKAILVMQTKGVLKFKPEGLEAGVVALDNTAMVLVKVPKADFVEYNITQDVECPLDITALNARLARCGPDVEVLINEEMQIRSVDKIYTIPLTEVKDDMRRPTLNFASTVKLPREDLIRMLDDCTVVSDKIKIVTTGEDIKFSAKGDLPSDVVEVTPELSDVTGQAEGTWRTDYLPKALAAVQTETAVMELSTGMPMRLTLGNVVFILGGWVGAKQ